MEKGKVVRIVIQQVYKHVGHNITVESTTHQNTKLTTANSKTL